MKGNTKKLLLTAGALLALAVVLYSCGGGYGGGGSYGGMGAVAPGMFSLSSPADMANPVGTTPALTWTASANAADYSGLSGAGRSGNWQFYGHAPD